MDPIPDFSDRRYFPGTHGNPFDKVLRRMEALEKIPLPFFAVLLFLVALLPTYGNWPWTAGLWLFFLGDLTLLALLPRAGRSYGEPQAITLLLALMRAPFALLQLPFALAFQITGTLLVIYGFWMEPHTVRVTRQRLQSSKLKPDQPALRVLHLGDLHIERITARERHLNRLIRELQPDLILFSGDVLNLSYVEDPVAWEAARQVMGEWQAPGGVFVVSGSPAVDLEHVFPQLVEGLPVHWLREDRLPVTVNGQQVDVIGLTCTHKPFIDGPKIAALAGQPTDRFTILLYHTPDLAPNAARTGAIDLQLSGHTHGGQVRLPLFGALYAGLLYGRRFQAGRYLLEKMTLYVTRGIGLEGKAAPRVRFLCPPEIILWEIYH